MTWPSWCSWRSWRWACGGQDTECQRDGRSGAVAPVAEQGSEVRAVGGAVGIEIAGGGAPVSEQEAQVRAIALAVAVEIAGARRRSGRDRGDGIVVRVRVGAGAARSGEIGVREHVHRVDATLDGGGVRTDLDSVDGERGRTGGGIPAERAGMPRGKRHRCAERVAVGCGVAPVEVRHRAGLAVDDEAAAGGQGVLRNHDAELARDRDAAGDVQLERGLQHVIAADAGRGPLVAVQEVEPGLGAVGAEPAGGHAHHLAGGGGRHDGAVRRDDVEAHLAGIDRCAHGP